MGIRVINGFTDNVPRPSGGTPVRLEPYPDERRGELENKGVYGNGVKN